MNLRESFEEREFQELSPYAAHSRNSRGRDRYEPECDIRTVYQRDRDRILHSKAFRRMKDKTQVFLAAQGDHYRTRLTHTLEVSQIARTIARALNLNEDLTEAIALGHDLGHTPFGHSGEAALNAVHPGGFRHAEQSVRVVEVLEKEGQGLNLTWEVRDGILNHRTAGKPSTLEGQVVRLCDKIAYIHHDMDDAIRAGILSEDDIPITIRVVLGDTCRERLNTLIHDIVEQSRGTEYVRQSAEIAEGMRMAVVGGTCRQAQFGDIEVCGKTGTAQNPHGRDHSAFMGFAPMNNPKIAIFVYVENARFGATIGVPIGGLMMEKYLTGQISPHRQYIEDRMLESNTIIYSGVKKH